MKKIFVLLIVVLCLLGCRIHPSVCKNGIVIICDGETICDSVLYITEAKKNGPQLRGIESIFQFSSCNAQEEIAPLSNIISDTLNIPFIADYIILHYSYNPVESVDLLLRNGDTLVINKNGAIPTLTLENRHKQTFGIQYDIERKSRYSVIYAHPAEILVQNPIILMLKSIREHFNYKQAYDEALNKVTKDNFDEGQWLDSLYSVKLLDSVEYRYFKTRNHYQHLNLELKHKTKPDLESILSAYSDSTYRNDFYLFYRNYYDAVTQKYYYNKTIQLSNGSDYDFKDAYQRIEQDTLLRGRLRDVHLSHCFRKIDEICSITDGKKYYDKVIKSIADTAILNALHRDYDKVYAQDIAFSDDLMLQNANGTETTLQKVLAANVGKVIYVDFWASWCAPCMAGMPASKKLREEYKNKDVIFIYLAFNDKEEAWRIAIPKAALNDVKNVYLVTNPRTSKVIDNLKLKTIPRYLIYDKKGQLANSNAPRPESDEIRNMLNSLAKAE